MLLWGFWEWAHWLGKDAALVDKNWEMTAAGERVSELLLKKWRTETTVKTDAEGRFSFDGFYGDYEITFGGKTHKVSHRKN